MTTLQGLPPLPKSLQALLCAGVAQWKEMEKTHQLRTLIQQQLAAENGSNGVSVGQSNGEQTEGSVVSVDTTAAVPTRPAVSATYYPATSRGIEAAISHLHQEMVSLRQLDMSLLCQLMSLNESIHEYKHLLHDRTSDTTSDCSSIMEDEHEYENTPYYNDKYVNEFFHRQSYVSTPTPPPEESIYEPVAYTDTVSSTSSSVEPPKMQKKNRRNKSKMDNGTDCGNNIAAVAATYESNC